NCTNALGALCAAGADERLVEAPEGEAEGGEGDEGEDRLPDHQPAEDAEDAAEVLDVVELLVRGRLQDALELGLVVAPRVLDDEGADVEVLDGREDGAGGPRLEVVGARLDLRRDGVEGGVEAVEERGDGLGELGDGAVDPPLEVVLGERPVEAEGDAAEALPGLLLDLPRGQRRDLLAHGLRPQHLLRVLGGELLQLGPEAGVLDDAADGGEGEVAVAPDDAAVVDLPLDDLLVDELLADGLRQPEDHALALGGDEALRDEHALLARLKQHRDGDPVGEEPDVAAHGRDSEQALD